MREELILIYREILSEKTKHKRSISAINIYEDVAEFQRSFMIYVYENHLDRKEAESFFEEIVAEAAPIGSELRKSIDPRICYQNLFGNK